MGFFWTEKDTTTKSVLSLFVTKQHDDYSAGFISDSNTQCLFPIAKIDYDACTQCRSLHAAGCILAFTSEKRVVMWCALQQARPHYQRLEGTPSKKKSTLGFWLTSAIIWLHKPNRLNTFYGLRAILYVIWRVTLVNAKWPCVFQHICIRFQRSSTWRFVGKPICFAWE